MTKIYFDESGHSGDMVNSGNNYDFQGQPYFALAGVGLEENHTWDNIISEMRGRHRIPDGELKSKSLTSKPKFSAEVINALIETEAPLFIEIVDKRFFICMTMTSTQLLAHWMGYEESKRLYQIRNTFADFLYFHASEQALSAFVTFCLSPSDTSLKASFASLLTISSHTAFHPLILPIATAFADTVKTAQDEYEKLNKKKKKRGKIFSRIQTSTNITSKSGCCQIYRHLRIYTHA